YSIFICLYVILNFVNVSSTTITAPRTIKTTLSSLVSSNQTPLITHFLVFSSNLETVIRFEPKQGWILNEEKKFRLYLSGINLQKSSLVFSASVNKCTSNDYISPIYSLSSTSIIEINVELQSISKSHSLVYVCLLTSWNTSLSILNNNNTESHSAKQLESAYFTFVREKSRLPFSAKICLILIGMNLGLMSMSVNDLCLIAESEDNVVFIVLGAVIVVEDTLTKFKITYKHIKIEYII
ncbi:unnamed protein product, partial [Rotaria sp. Silwood1]